MSVVRRKAAHRALSREDGFTLVELLVVLIIIGILAAIAIAIFSGQQNKAHDADAKTSARSAQIAMETYFTEHSSYSGATVTELAMVYAPGLTVSAATSNTYSLSTLSTSTTPVTYSVARAANSTITRSCTPPNAGGCKNGAW
jgi:type IV pilus assembly protein PilA